VAQHADTAINDGPWLCSACRGHIVQHGLEDLYFDFGLLDYLFAQHLPESIDERERILKLASEYRAHGGELQRRRRQHPGLPGRWRWANVPPVRERIQIVKDTHDTLGHVGRDRLLSDIQNVWYWPGLRDDVTLVLQACPAC
jgi:Integrase zinc binding domain